MPSLKEWFRKRPVIAFFVLAFAISWALWLPWIAIRSEILELLGLVGLFGPALACVLVARAIPAQPRSARPRYPWIPFVLAWTVSTLILGANSQAARSGASPVVWIIFAMLALVPTYVIASIFNGPPGVRATLGSIVHPTGSWGWYALAVLLPPVTRLLSAGISRSMGWELLSQPALPLSPLQIAGAVLVAFLYTVLYAGGLNEEAGWTGLALPGLQARFSPLIASLIIWVFWIIWHVPISLAGYQDLGPHVLIGTFFARFIFTWLYNRSSGGVLTAILFHASANVASQFIPITNMTLVVEAVLAVAILIGAKMWQRMPAGAVSARLAEA